MATALEDSARQEDWGEPSAIPRGGSLLTRPELLWTLVGLTLLGAFLSLVVEDFPLRTVMLSQ